MVSLIGTRWYGTIYNDLNIQLNILQLHEFEHCIVVLCCVVVDHVTQAVRHRRRVDD